MGEVGAVLTRPREEGLGLRLAEHAGEIALVGHGVEQLELVLLGLAKPGEHGQADARVVPELAASLLRCSQLEVAAVSRPYLVPYQLQLFLTLGLAVDALGDDVDDSVVRSLEQIQREDLLEHVLRLLLDTLDSYMSVALLSD